VWAIRGATVLGVLVLIASAVDKPLWDWLDLLIVPGVLAVGGYLFNSSQNQATRRAAEQRAQDESLQAYLDQMGKLLLEEDLRGSGEDSQEARNVARARTLIALGTRNNRGPLDPNRKGAVMRFLLEAELVGRRGAGKAISGESHSFAIDLGEGRAYVISLSYANLRDVNLGGAILVGTNLAAADLSGANLSGALLTSADMGGADLSDANLKNAALFDANLSGANLKNAALSDTKLSGANLSGTDLSVAVGVTEEQIDQAKSLVHATMPTGQIYEAWLQELDEKAGRGERLSAREQAHLDRWAKMYSREDGENSGPSRQLSE